MYAKHFQHQNKYLINLSCYYKNKVKGLQFIKSSFNYDLAPVYCSCTFPTGYSKSLALVTLNYSQFTFFYSSILSSLLFPSAPPSTK